jgi:imidazolonepropionase
MFFETGYFTVAETEQIMNAGAHFGLSQNSCKTSSIGGIQAG